MGLYLTRTLETRFFGSLQATRTRSTRPSPSQPARAKTKALPDVALMLTSDMETTSPPHSAGYTYTPNKALSEPASARKTPAARRMAQLTSGGSPPELAALGDAATWQDEEDATLQHVGAEAEKNLGEEDGEEENGDMEIGGTGEEAESMDLREGREALVNKESLEDVGKTVETAELTNGVQEEHVPNVTASGGAPQDMTSAEGPPETLALEARPEETETPGQGDGVNAGGDKESLPAGPGAVAFHTKRATRRSAADAPAGKTTRKHWVVRQSLAEGLEANPRRKATGRKLAAPETDTAGQKERKSTVQEESGLIQDSAPELGADKLRENEVDVTGREGLADEGGLTIESSGERGLRRGRAGRKTVSFAAAVEAGFSDPVKEAVSGMSVGLDADNGKRVKERASHGRAGNRRKSVGAELLAVEKGTGGTAEANGGHELTTGEPAMEQSRKQAGGRKRVSFAASTNHDGGNETTDPERDPKNEGVQAAARRQSMGVTFPPPTAADVSEELPAGSPDVSEGVLAPEAVGAAASQPASEPAESGTGAKAIAKRGRGRRATAKTVAAVESESIAALALGSDIESQSVEPAAEITAEVTADTTKVKGRNARSKGAVALGAGPEGVTSAGRTRGSRAAEGAEFGGTDAKSPPKRGRGRKRAVGKVGEPVNGTGQTQNTEAGGNKHPADVTGEKVEVTLPQGPVGSSRTGRKSTAPGSEASAAQPGTGPAGKTAVGKVRRGVLEDSTNVQEGNEVRGARGRGTVKERGQGEAGPGKSVNAVESVKEPEVAVGTRVEVWWADDNR